VLLWFFEKSGRKTSRMLKMSFKKILFFEEEIFEIIQYAIFNSLQLVS